MWIMVSGPYTSGGANTEERSANLRAMNDAALILLRAGHVPVIGVNLALPIIDAAGEASFDDIMMPLSLAVAEWCDACLRIGSTSKGADREVALFRKRGLPVYFHVEDVPTA